MLKLLLGLMLLACSTAGLAQNQAAAVPAPAETSVPTTAAAPAPANIEAYVREQTKGGELDFTKMLASKKQSMFLHDGNMYTKPEYALVLWGLRVKALGIESAERACALYAAASNRPLTPAEKKALVQGFDSGTRD
ncbi:hypothetical protein F0P96_02935 [Hymenobacter busanensis]|uniref:Uncharacterized protein n=1 Tax=Hymenobacter busanensis TaxID=2607656 RepID=A0A7L4ZYW6_9BACT|nr:hypothetical protein [Hymenobacter busanensis]KAA9339584.1 hypothetical protein F0P96_02935 [Hymenobacter busanensis]QHJ06660.1 hypothetical protein GUY19_04820 [Hymenobacter busanensis]